MTTTAGMGDDTIRAGPSKTASMNSRPDMVDLPTRPIPAAIGLTTTKADIAEARDEKQVPHYGADTSVDSTRTFDSIDLEKGVIDKDVHSCPEKGSERRETGSKEKVQRSHGSDTGMRTSTHLSSSERIQDNYEEVDTDEVEPELEQKALKILFMMALPLPALAILTSIYTLATLTLMLLLSPLRLCTRSSQSFRPRLLLHLIPASDLHLRCIYARTYALVPTASSADSNVNAGRLLAVLLLAPVLTLAMAVASWVLGVYWIFAAIVGNPDGLDGRNDGREVVLGLRGWWKRWLIWPEDK